MTFPANRERVEQLRGERDWLIVAGDVAEKIPDVVSALAGLAQRFEKVIWTPGNHELFNRKSERIAGKARYRALVGELRALGIVTPEDPYPRFGPVTVCPLFTLYDYSFARPGLTVDNARMKLDDTLAIAPYVDVRAWCAERIDYTQARLEQVSGPTVLVNHWPLIDAPLHRLPEPDISLWCGTRKTTDWPHRFRARAVVYGHLHMPGEMRIDGVSHYDVSLGYPFEPRPHARPWPLPVVRLG